MTFKCTNFSEDSGAFYFRLLCKRKLNEELNENFSWICKRKHEFFLNFRNVKNMFNYAVFIEDLDKMKWNNIKI